MTTRDLAIILDPAQEQARDRAAAGRRYTRAGEVEVWRCLFKHTETDGCRGQHVGGPAYCGEVTPAFRRFDRVDAPYTQAELRAIMRVEWGEWWASRKRNRDAQ